MGRGTAVKSDNEADYGVHVFEKAGLGKRPYTLVDIVKKKYSPCPGAPAQPGGTCAFCYTGIMFCYVVESSDGKRFEVGCDCINKAGDSGLIRAYKTSPKHRAIEAERRRELDQKKRAELDALLADESVRVKLKSRPHPREDLAKQGRTLLDFIHTSLDWSGAAGRARNLRMIKQVIGA